MATNAVQFQSTLDVASKGPRHEAVPTSLDDAPSLIAWFNEALASNQSLTSLDDALAGLAVTLATGCHEARSCIDETIAQVASNLPHLGVQIRFVRQGTQRVRTSLATVQSAAALQNESFASSAPAALARLSALATLRSRMSSARHVLRLAESWSTLSPDVLAHLSDAKFELAAARLAEAAKSLPVFERTPEYDSRARLLNSLVDGLQEHLRPKVLDAVAARDLEASERCARVLDTVARGQQFAQQWRDARAQACLKQWTSSSEEARATASVRLQYLWPRLLASIGALLEEECVYVERLFPSESRRALESLILVILERLTPTLSASLHQVVDELSPPDALNALIRAHTSAIEAVTRWTPIILSLQQPSTPQLPSDAANTSRTTLDPRTPGVANSPSATRSRPTPSISRRLSRRRSLLPPLEATKRAAADGLEVAQLLSGSSVLSTGGLRSTFASLTPPSKWETILWTPFLSYQTSYAALEAPSLATAWSQRASTSASQPVGSLAAPSFSAQVRTAIAMGREALDRSQQFTFGLSAADLLKEVDALLEHVINHTRSQHEISARVATDAARTRAADLLARDEEEGYGEAESWSAFEAGVDMLRAAQEAKSSIEGLEDYIATALADIAAAFLYASSRSGDEVLTTVLGSTSNTGQASALSVLLDQLDLNSPRVRDVMETLRSHHASKSTSTSTNRPAVEARRVSGSVAGSRAASTTLLPAARGALRAHVRALQRAQCEVILAPLLPALEAYTTLGAWEATRLPGAVNEYDLAMPTFSLSPTRIMGHVGEGLLDLPRLLEVWADDASLAWAVDALPHAQTAEPLQNEGSTSHAQAKRMSLVLDGAASAHLVRSDSRAAPFAGSTVTPPPNASSGTVNSHQPTPDVVLQAYLRALALSLLAHVTDVVLPSIARLTPAGAAQLAADLDYLDNILASLNVDAQSLHHWRDACALSDLDGRTLQGGAVVNRTSWMESEPFATVARMRGW